jgi:putative SOS response-associated peptidase YedK
VTGTFTILTTTPNAEMAALHDRMPVILEQQDWPVWLGEAEGDHAALLRAAPDGLLRVWPVRLARRLAAQQRLRAAGGYCRVGRHDLPRTSGILFRQPLNRRYGQ